MNQALIQHLESLPSEHLEVHLAAYPWFAAARVVLAKKSPSQQAVRQTIPYVSDRKWFKNYFQNRLNFNDQLHETPNEIITTQETDSENSKHDADDFAPINENQLFPTNTDKHFNEKTISNQEFEAPIDEYITPTHSEESTTIDISKAQTFSDWISYFSAANSSLAPTNAPAKSKPPKNQKDELEMLIQSNLPYEIIESKIEAETNYSKGLSDFIAQQKRHKKQQIPAPNFDEKSRLPITETLAKLLENQGKIKQAIGIYEQLSLKFPQKSAYFAARIQSLKEKI